jgi:hypothetical protein
MTKPRLLPLHPLQVRPTATESVTMSLCVIGCRWLIHLALGSAAGRVLPPLHDEKNQELARAALHFARVLKTVPGAPLEALPHRIGP